MDEARDPKAHPPISDEGRALRKRSIAWAKASVRLEGTIVPAEIEALNARYIDGQITSQEHVKLVLKAVDAMTTRKAVAARGASEGAKTPTRQRVPSTADRSSG